MKRHIRRMNYKTDKTTKYVTAPKSNNIDNERE